MTATNLQRFMSCNGSYFLEKIESFDPDQTVTEEGNAAHWVIEQVCGGHATLETLTDKRAPNGIFITADMIEHVRPFIDNLKGIGEVEVEVNHCGENYEVRGRADHIYYDDDRKTLYITDFKYGWKIVEPYDNWTLISHAVGYMRRNVLAQKAEKIVFVIYQPRPFHPDGVMRSYEMLIEEFSSKTDQMLIALRQPVELCMTGPHCYKCPSLGVCRAASVATMNSIDVAYGVFNADIDSVNLAKILDEIDRAFDMLKQSKSAYEELAMHRLKIGKSVGSYTLQTGKGHTKWKEHVTSDMIQALTGIDCSRKVLMTPAQSKKLGVPEGVIESFTERPDTGLKLVRVDLNKQAEKLFGSKQKGKKK
jgi:hypothetical protein